MTINIVGYFFNVFTPTKDPSVFAVHDMGTGLSAINFDAFVLLHELGRLTGVLGNDIKNPGLADAFNAKILKDCFGVSDWKP